MDLKAIHYMYFNSSIFTAMATSVILLKPLVLFFKKKKKEHVDMSLLQR